MVPGFAFESVEHGWFRIITSNSIDLLKIAIKRIKKTLDAEVLLKSGLKRGSTVYISEFEHCAKKACTESLPRKSNVKAL